MSRDRWQRRWIKLHIQQCLDGSIRWQLEPDERGVWYDLLVLAGICQNEGLIGDRDGRPFPIEFIANRLNIPLEMLERTLVKCIAEGRIKKSKEGLHIVHWKEYQSEYERQKPYREKPESTEEQLRRMR